MAYKTILVHVDEAPHSAARILLAGELALQEGAHVIGVATTGISRFSPGAMRCSVKQKQLILWK